MTTKNPTQPTLADLQKTLEQILMADFHQVFDALTLPTPLDAAARYAVSNGGKRVRPLLVLAAFISLGGVESNLAMPRRAMLAIESIHSYSLVHDDLPCMDDDELRRGKPTCHIAYGEATALLVGDVLQSLAFEVLSSPTLLTQDFNPKQAFRLIQALAPQARRMVAGQQLDLTGENRTLTQSQLQAIHQDKTGALIEAAVLMGAICADADQQTLDKLQDYARSIGLAFQVQDDVLDITSDTQTLGKPTGSDEKLQKSTYVKLLGVSGATDYANGLFDHARTAVADLGENNLLLQVVDWLQKRRF